MGSNTKAPTEGTAIPDSGQGCAQPPISNSSVAATSHGSTFQWRYLSTNIDNVPELINRAGRALAHIITDYVHARSGKQLRAKLDQLCNEVVHVCESMRPRDIRG